MDGASDDETLASVLAFLDSYDADDGDEVFSPAISNCASPTAVNWQRIATVTRGNRSKHPAGYTTELQRRKRAELAALREQVAELESHLYQLQYVRSHGGSDAVAPSPGRQNPKRWVEAAVTERRLRLRAESANRKLKAMVKHEFDLHADVLRVMQKHRRSPEVDELWTTYHRQIECLYSPIDQAQYMASWNEMRVPAVEIQAQLETLKLDTPKVLGVTVNDDVVSCSMETKTDSSIGQFIEIRTATTTEHRSGASIMSFYWRERKDAPIGVWKYLDEVDPNADAFSRKSVLALRCRSSGPTDAVHLNVQHHARKFESASQAVVVMVALIHLPVTGVCLREDFWTRITRRARQQVVVETCYRIYHVDHAGGDGDTSEAAGMSVFVSTTLAQITRHNMLAAQNWLLDDEIAACCWLHSDNSRILHSCSAV